jgi:hypothetical protein
MIRKSMWALFILLVLLAGSGVATTLINLETQVKGVLAVVNGGTGVSTAQGNGSKVQLSTGSTSTNDCVKFDANGNTVSAGSACGTVPSFADAEVPSGTINGSNTAFTLAHTASPAASLILTLNGVVQKAGGVDYTLSGTGITMAAAPVSGDGLLAWYRY